MRHWLAFGLYACTGDPKNEDPTGPTDTDADTDADTDTDTDTDTVIREARFDAAAEILVRELEDPYNLATAASIAVCQGGVPLWREGFGTSNPEGEVAVTPDQLFQIGSTTKHMTASLVLQQVQDGLYTLEDPVASVLPAFSIQAAPLFPAAAEVRELISHQGGLVDWLDWEGPTDDAALAAWHYGAASQELFSMSPPGAFYNYSNPNFTLAGLIVEEHDPQGRAFPDVMAQDLFAPLGLHSTFIRKADLLAADMPYVLSTGLDPVSYAPHPLTMDEVLDPALVRPAGLVWSTPSDMCRWGDFVLHGDPALLDDALREEITSPQVSTLSYDAHSQYGFGMFVWDLWPMTDGAFYPIRVWEHGGNTPSFSSTFLLLPDQNVVISLLSNGYGDTFIETVEAILQTVVEPWPDPSDYQPVFDPDALEVHLGSYESLNLGPMEVTAGGTYGLQLAAPVLAQYGYSYDPELIPFSTDVWLLMLEGEYFDLTFIRDAQGGPTPFIRNQSFVGQRVADQARTARPAVPDREMVEATLRAVHPR